MTTGLAGSGSEKEWRVDLDEKIGTNLYGVTLANGQFWLQVAPLQMSRITQLRDFLRASRDKDGFRLDDVFGGKLEFLEEEGKLLVRVVQCGAEFGTNLFEIVLRPDERAALSLALEKAIEDAK